MAVPKQRKSHSKTRMGKAHLAIKVNGLSTCSYCSAVKIAHIICNTCGYYNGRKYKIIQKLK